MPKSINAQLAQLKFPNTCVVCLSPSSKEYKLEGTFNYGRRSYTVEVHVPMCESHFSAASYKSPAERFFNWIAVFGGLFIGLICAILLIFRWASDESILFKLIGGGIFGLGMFAIFWWIVSVSIAPQFATRDAKEARTAVRILHFWPREQVVQLEFKHETIADRMLNAN